MGTYFLNCKSSFGEFRRTKSIVLMALLAAMSIVISGFKIKVFPHLHIGFSTLVNQYTYHLIGPVAGSIYAAVLDIVKEFIMPSGKFNLLFTITPVLAGFTYGSFYYRRKITLLNSLVANLIVKMVFNVIITTTIISLTQGKAMMAILPLRAIKNLIQWPVDSLLFYSLAKLLDSVRATPEEQR